ncbi:Holliday junction branch migration protein RuvA [Nodularia spumigena]|uniref:Holliday junction branch migration protein RuvA n=1 Tax=Nodularia spumigena TaxID=70799 RepID=UPI002B209C28|nr:Holliday junction branch migration protein RuvA [Nodularia spumigena]MEA5557653.1 Holliday junction branch migration protein RuvA [Nodularia spumigena CH309]
MIRKIEGRLEGMEGLGALVVPSGSGLTYEVLVPAYLAERLLGQVGRNIELLTLEYLEGQGQGASFIPRLVGFGSAQERKFYELLITVKGMGNRKALKALAIEPGAFARAIAERDARALQQLPEIGKRMAETVIAELIGKVEPFVTYDGPRSIERRLPAAAIGPVADAISALVALGESRADAERLVDRVSSSDPTLESAEAIIGAALAMR